MWTPEQEEAARRKAARETADSETTGSRTPGRERAEGETRPVVTTRTEVTRWTPPVVPFADVESPAAPQIPAAPQKAPVRRRPPPAGRCWAGLRVCHVIGGGDEGGALSLVVPLLQALREQGVEVELVCLGDGGLAAQASRRGLAPTVFPMDSPFDTGVVAPLLQYIAQAQCGIVHTHGMRATVPLRLARRSLPPAVRLFTTVHSDVVWDYQSRLRGAAFAALDLATSRACDQVICVSEGLRRRLSARRFPTARLVVVRPSLPPDPLRPLPPDPSQTRWWPRETPQAMRVIDDEDVRWIGTATRLVRVKDLDLMLQAAAGLFRLVPQARLVIMGDGPERTRLERRALDLGIRARVAFTGWLQPIWPAMSRLSAYWLTSRSEGLPVSVLEAMAMGLPVVSTDVGGVSEAIRDGVDGFTVRRCGRRRMAAALAEAAGFLLTHAERARSMGLAGAVRVAHDFSPARAARLHVRLYQRALTSME